MYQLPSLEIKRIQAGKLPTREDIKTFDKDLKTLVTFFIQRHQFIKVHMIYKRISSTDKHPHPISVAGFQVNLQPFEKRHQNLLKGIGKVL